MSEQKKYLVTYLGPGSAYEQDGQVYPANQPVEVTRKQMEKLIENTQTFWQIQEVNSNAS